MTEVIIDTIHKSIFSLLHNVFNLLPNDNILGLSKLKVFGDDKIKVTEDLKFVL